jgi:hypothetical protein
MSGVRSEQERGSDEPGQHDDARDHHGDARSRQGFAFADRGVHRSPSAPRQSSGHDTRHDQQDANRVPRPTERLPRQEPYGGDAGGGKRERRPKPGEIRPFIRELELRVQDSVRSWLHPCFRVAESLVRATKRTSTPGIGLNLSGLGVRSHGHQDGTRVIRRVSVQGDGEARV